MLNTLRQLFKFNPSIALFGMPMGLFGLGMNGHHFETVLGWHTLLPELILSYGALALFVVGIPYFWHWLKNLGGDHTLKSEWQDPFQLSLFPSLTLTLMLFALALYQFDIFPEFAFAFFGIVLFLHTLLFLIMVSRWIFDQKVLLSHLKPTWFILLSGNFVAVIAGSQFLPQAWQELLWFYFSASLFIWVTLVVSLFYKLFFTEGIPLNFRPTLFIFLAPPSLGTIAGLILMGDDTVNLISWVFYSFASLMLAVWAYAIVEFKKSQLSMVGWAYVYPLAAYGLATQYLAELLSDEILWWWSGMLFLVTIGFVLLLSVWLLKQAKRQLATERTDSL
jgi:tellurite resistance protein TehA-like permease